MSQDHLRRFEHRPEWVGGAHPGEERQVRTVYVIRCEDCGNEEKLRIKARSIPDDQIALKFHQMGWVIGNNRKHDLCPNCLERKRRAKEALRAAREQAKTEAVKEVTNGHKTADQIMQIGKLTPDQVREGRSLVADLTDRAATILDEQTHLQATMFAAMDRLAALENQTSALNQAIHALSGMDDIDLQKRVDQLRENEDMFTKLAPTPRGNALRDREVRISYYSKGKNGDKLAVRQTMFTLSPMLASELGYTTDMERATLAIGDGEDAGLVLIERTRDARMSLKASRQATGSVRITTSQLTPANTDRNLPSQSCKFIVREGGLIVRLPEDWLEKNWVKESFSGAREALAASA